MLRIDRRALLASVLGREGSLLSADVAERERDLRDAIAGRRMLIVGAAGSIGSAFVRQLVAFRPAGLVLVDTDENALVEVVRDLRSGNEPPTCDLSTLSIGLGGAELERYLADSPPFDAVLNFAALKHVRAERDPFTLMRMLDVNVLAWDRTVRWAKARGTRAFFSVSSDKAVRPANLMGASKAWMEQVQWRHADGSRVTSARFANVAFSAGSLLDGFLHRIDKGQPLAAPTDVRRYFISADEAGQLCLLAAFLGGARDVFVPELGGSEAALPLTEVAARVLRQAGREPILCATDDEARAHPALLDEHARGWPCYFAPSDTSGEKDVEEFVGPEESLAPSAFRAVGVVRARPLGAAAIDAVLADLAAYRDRRAWRKEEIVAIVRRAVPELRHLETGRSLDARM